MSEYTPAEKRFLEKMAEWGKENGFSEKFAERELSKISIMIPLIYELIIESGHGKIISSDY